MRSKELSTNPGADTGNQAVVSPLGACAMEGDWHTSSYCSMDSACVEVAVRAEVSVRDTEDPGQVLRFDANAWRGFLQELQLGGFRD